MRARCPARLALLLGLTLSVTLSDVAHVTAQPQATPQAPAAATPVDPHRAASEHHGHDGKGGHGKHAGGSDSATTHHRFEDAKYWSSVFDDPARDAWQKPEEVVKALELKPGETVADLGAGTGYFNRHLSPAVGPTGTVYGVDVEPNLVGFMRDRADTEKTANVVPVLASYDNPRLPRASLDALLVVDTYHHIDERKRYFEQARALFKPGGRLVIVDFHKKPLPVGPKPDHKLDQSQVISELEAAGYTLVREVKTLPYQYVLVFRVKG